jgi:hypothetical protein
MVPKHFFTISLFVMCVLFLVPSDAYAYLDPGSGSFIIQIILAGIMGLMLMAKIYWKKIRGFFGKETIEDTGDDD